MEAMRTDAASRAYVPAGASLTREQAVSVLLGGGIVACTAPVPTRYRLDPCAGLAGHWYGDGSRWRSDGTGSPWDAT